VGFREGRKDFSVRLKLDGSYRFELLFAQGGKYLRYRGFWKSGLERSLQFYIRTFALLEKDGEAVVRSESGSLRNEVGYTINLSDGDNGLELKRPLLRIGMKGDSPAHFNIHKYELRRVAAGPRLHEGAK